MISKPIAIPSTVRKADLDYVSYCSVSSDGSKAEHKDSPCYSSIMSSLTKVSVICRARPLGVPVDTDCFIAWMELCKKHRLVPRKAHFYSERKKNYLEIPSGAYDKHLVYAALCCYRFSESFAPMVWQIVAHSQKLKDVTFWQLLHYGFAKHYSYGIGHSFSMIYTGANCSIYGKQHSKNLAESIALKEFFGKTIRTRKDITGQTNQAVSSLADTLGGYEVTSASKERCKKNGEKFMKQHGYVPYHIATPPATEPVLKIKKLEDLLTPKWTPMFLLKRPTKARLRKLYKAA